MWFDGAELKLGESITRQIDKGIARFRIGVVLVTETLIEGRYWTEKEIGALFSGRRRIIPILEGVTFDDLGAYSPLLADAKGLSTEYEGIGEIAEQIANAIKDAAEAG